MKQIFCICSFLVATLLIFSLAGFTQSSKSERKLERSNERQWRRYQRFDSRDTRKRLAKENQVDRCRKYGKKKWGFEASASVYTSGQAFHPRYVRMESGELLLKTHEPNVYVDTSAIRKLPITTRTKHTLVNICDYQEDSLCYVTVYEGLISILMKGHSVGLSPYQYAIIKGDSLQVHNLPLFDERVQSDRTWLNGTYDFVNKPLYLVINRAARMTHFTVEYKRKPKHRVTGSIFADHHLLTIVSTLHSSLGGFGYSVDTANKKVTIN